MQAFLKHLLPDGPAAFSTKVFEAYFHFLRLNRSLAFLNMMAEIIFAKSVIQNSTFLPFAIGKNDMAGTSRANVFTGDCLTGLSYQVQGGPSLRKLRLLLRMG
jgi:hypothetical protein